MCGESLLNKYGMRWSDITLEGLRGRKTDTDTNTEILRLFDSGIKPAQIVKVTGRSRQHVYKIITNAHKDAFTKEPNTNIDNIFDAWMNGDAVSKIATTFGYSVGQIGHIIKNHPLYDMEKHKRRAMYKPYDKERVMAMLKRYKEGATLKQIGMEFGYGHYTQPAHGPFSLLSKLPEWKSVVRK